MLKFTRTLHPSLLGLLLLVAITTQGCQKATQPEPEAAYPTPTPAAQVVLEPGKVSPGVGLDTIKLGQSQKDVIALLGEPEERDNNEFAPGQLYVLYYSQGIELTFADDKLEVITLHSQTAKWKAYAGATSEGVGVGSSQDDIVKALGEPAADDTRALRYPKLGLWFRLDGDRGTTDRTVRAETLQVMKPE